MASVTVGVSHPCALLNAGSFRPSVSRKTHLGSLSLAWDPLVPRSGLRVSAVNRRNDNQKRRIAPRGRTGKDEIEEERVCEYVESEKGAMIKFGENLKDLIRPAVKPAIAVFLAGMLLLQPMDDAMAASSGGRMGGRSFKSAPPPSRSYSGGGGGGGGGRSYSAPPIYGSPFGYGSPYGFSPFSPFFGGGYYGGGLVLGPPIGFGGGGFLIFAMIAFVTLRAIAGFFRDRFGDRDGFDD